MIFRAFGDFIILSNFRVHFWLKNDTWTANGRRSLDCLIAMKPQAIRRAEVFGHKELDANFDGGVNGAEQYSLHVNPNVIGYVARGLENIKKQKRTLTNLCRLAIPKPDERLSQHLLV
ncbi:hypothetical protein QJS10_CPB18g01016 [Acorus calamus]|uniref:Uncharacterized protein n=1 Tax=Acorus calamus TaxID=4465 RepID=A0AAV9CN32_ACOCL|nr:hypothetical protein QJS10_CPB18g01016 [Acorus calamus]